MAWIERYVAKQTFIDSTGKSSTVETRVASAAATTYLTAVDKAARDATSIGALFAATAALSSAVEYQRSVEKIDEQDSVADAAAGVYHFDKIAVSTRAGLDNYSSTIPARKMAAIDLADDGVTIDTADGAEVQTYVTALQAVALAKNGATVSVTRMRVSQ